MATEEPDNKAAFTHWELAEATDGELAAEPQSNRDPNYCGVTTDSRKMTPKGIFVAIRGGRRDGHEFLSQLPPHSGIVVCEDASTLPRSIAACVVPDTTLAYQAIAKFHFERWRKGRQRHVIAITGSAGKTTTKEFVAAALRGVGLRVRATVGNLNNGLGVPMTMLTVEDEDDAVVLELGTNAPGEIALLSSLVSPDIGLITLVSAAHTEGLGSEEGVFAEKSSLFQFVRKSGTCIWNRDDAWLNRIDASQCGDRNQLRIGRDNADISIRKFATTSNGTTVSLVVAGRDYEVPLRAFGEGAAYAAAAAAAVTATLGLNVGEALAALSRIEPVEGRFAPKQVGSWFVVDDSYNANPASMRVSLETAAALANARGGRLFVVLGDMKELGVLSRERHADVIALATKLAVHSIFVGEEMAAAGANVVGVEDVVSHLPRPDSADVILLKASRSMRLERVLAQLHPQDGAT